MSRAAAGNGSRSGTANLIWFLVLFVNSASMAYLSGPVLDLAALVADQGHDAGSTRRVYLGCCYCVMLVACIIRGRAIDRNWLAVFLLISAAFDMLAVPFVPTAMNVVVLGAGLYWRRTS